MTKRKCRCQICGKWGYTDEFYRVRKKDRNIYYCSEKEYLNMLDEEIARIELLRYISNNIWYHDSWKMLPPVLKKELKELAKIYNYEVLLETVKQIEDDLKYWMSLENKFKTDYAQARYMSVIIKNNINDVWRQWKKEQEILNKSDEIIANVDVDALNHLQQNNKNKKVDKGIYKFLKEGDL